MNFIAKYKVKRKLKAETAAINEALTFMHDVAGEVAAHCASIVPAGHQLTPEEITQFEAIACEDVAKNLKNDGRDLGFPDLALRYGTPIMVEEFRRAFRPAFLAALTIGSMRPEGAA